jgi:hypothetical protein
VGTRRRYASLVELGRPLASQLGRKVKTQTSLPGFDSPNDAVQVTARMGDKAKPLAAADGFAV